MQKFILTLLLTLLAAGCQTLGPAEERGASVKAPEKPRALPFETPAPTHAELDGELLFDYLIGEIGMRQGDFSAALQGYLQAAETTGDPYAAERATRLALHTKDLDAAIRGASLWARYAPNSIDARKYFGALLLRQGRLDDAFAQFDAMRRIADAEGKDGLLLVAAVLAGEPGQEGARAMFERLVSDAPDAPESRYARALLNSAHGRYAEAEQDLVKALEARPRWPQARLLLSQVLIASRRSDQALEVLRSGVELQPDNKLLRNRYARLLVATHAYDEALAQFRALHRLDPEDLEVTYGFAMLATQQQAWDEARKLWQQLRKQPKYAAEATYFLAQVEEQAGRHELALSLYRSVNEGPLVVDATIRAALLLQQSGELAQARELLRRMRLEHPDRAVDLYLAETQLLQAAKVSSKIILGLYAKALREHGDNVELLYNRGLYYAQLGRYREMEADFKAVLAKDPQNVNALNAMGYMLAEQNTRLREARAYIEQALQLQPDSAAILDSMGWVLYRLGDLDGATNYLRRAYAKDQDEEIAAHLIEVLWASGDRQSARRLLESVSSKHRDSAQLSTLRERLSAESR